MTERNGGGDSMSRKRVVVIDDCRFTLQLLYDMLTEMELHVDLATSSAAANRLIYRVPLPDLILMDIEMPDTRGDDKVKLLKMAPGFKAIPVILISSKTSEEMERICQKSGADGYLVKPITRTDLEKKLEFLFRQ